MSEENLSNIDQEILSRFRRDTLCKKCQGPVERERLTNCWKCDTIPHIRAQLDWIDTASMNMSLQLGIKRKPDPVRQIPTEPQKKPQKKTTKTKQKKK